MFFSPSEHKEVVRSSQVFNVPKECWRDRMKFIRALISHPLRMGAILPSSEALASAITADLQPGSGKVLELGSGTGVFTSRMLEMGFAPADLILVEQDATLAAGLRTRYPASTILQMPAQALELGASSGRSEVAATICGLPLRNMSDTVHKQMLAAVFNVMVARGVMYLFTYGRTCPISTQTLSAHSLVAQRIGFVIRNFPPAVIYRVSRK